MNTPATEIRETPEQMLVTAALIPGSLCTTGFANWDGSIEVGRCLQVDAAGTMERTDDPTVENLGFGPAVWSIYLHQREGGVAHIADFETETQADAFGAALHVYREYLFSFPAFALASRKKPYSVTATAAER